VFQRDSANEGYIYTMNDDGTNLTRLVAGAQPAWSPDHSQIVFVDKITVFIMNADGTRVRQLTDSRWEDSMPIYVPQARAR